MLGTISMRIQVTARGFKPWTYPNPIRLNSEEERELIVNLEAAH